MNQETIHKAVAGAICGFVGAALVDLHAWGGASYFDWKKAVGRWIAGGASGFMSGLGLASVAS